MTEGCLAQRPRPSSDHDCLIYVNSIACSVEQPLMMQCATPGPWFDTRTITVAELRARAARTGDAERARRLLILAEELEERTSLTPSVASGASKLFEENTFPMTGRGPTFREALPERFHKSAVNAPMAGRKRVG